MSQTVVFTGAGASRAFGFPLTDDLLPSIRAELRNGTIFGHSPKARKDAEELSAYLVELFPGFELDDIKLPLITDILSLIDLSIASSNLPLSRRTTTDMMRFRLLLERAIFRVLRQPYAKGKVPPDLVRFSEWLYSLSRGGGESVGLISTNYDVAVETELFKKYAEDEIKDEFDFGFAWRSPFRNALYKRPPDPSVILYKLHGSLNWLRCELCEHIYINTRGVIAQLAFAEEILSGNTCHCGHAMLRAVLVAPSLVRDVRDGNLLEIWKNALELLRVASEWVIIGYSFPPEDIAIRSLFIRAYRGRYFGQPPRIRVVQKGDDETTRSRYRLFFPDCRYETQGLEGFLSALPQAV